MVKPFEVKVSGKYGAPMGRRSDINNLAQTGKPVHLQRVPFVDGDYDPGGAYWGGGTPLYCAWDDEGVAYIRAKDREDAKRQLREYHENIRFYP